MAEVLKLVPMLALIGCSSGAMVELGTGMTSFEELADGDAIPIIEGPQGGFHLWVSVRARDLDPFGVRITIDIAPRATGHPRQTTMPLVDLLPLDGWDETVGIVAGISAIECYDDRESVLRVVATDRAGRQAMDERIVVPTWEGPLEPCPP